MSLELHAFIDQDLLPQRSDWQAALASLDLPLELDPTLDLARDSGFSPCRLRSEDSGFEIYVDPIDEMVSAYPQLVDKVRAYRHVISFRWGRDLRECGCALAAAAALVQQFRAIVYDPQEARFCDLETLLNEFAQAMAETDR